MAVWTSETHTDYLDNAVVIYHYSDGVHKMTEINANEGYALTEVNYTPEYDADGNEIPHLYHLTICVNASVSYALFVAIPIEDGMDVAGNTDKPEIM